MRRLLFLALFAALVAGVSFGQPAITGMFQYGVYSDFQKTPEQALYGKLIITEPLDKFSTIVFRFRWKDLNFVNGEAIVTAPAVPANPTVVSPDWDIDRFYISTDVTGALGVTGNVTMKLGFGFQDPNGADLTGGISPFEVADLSGNDVGGGSQATIFPVFTFNKMVNIGAIIAPGQFNKDPSNPRCPEQAGLRDLRQRRPGPGHGRSRLRQPLLDAGRRRSRTTAKSSGSSGALPTTRRPRVTSPTRWRSTGSTT